MTESSRSARTGSRAATVLVAVSLVLSSCGAEPAPESGAEEDQASSAASTPPGEFAGVSLEPVPGSDGAVRRTVLESSNEGAVDPYDAEVQQAVAETVEELAADEETSPDDPLLVLNPYGTSTTGMYARFDTPVDGTLSYTVSSPGTEDWTRTARDASPDPAVLETQLVGVVPGAENTVTTTFRPADGSAPIEHQVRLTAPEARSGHPAMLERSGGEAEVQQLTDGLFMLSGVDGDQGATPLVDNGGVVRGEIIGRGYRADRIAFHEDTMVVPVDLSTVARIDPLGRAVEIHQLEGLKMHHDFTVTEDGEMVVLVDDESKDSVEDVVAVLDLDTGESRVLLDFDDLMGSYKDMTVEWAWSEDGAADMDWLHFNSVDLLDEDSLVLSARETSAVIKVDDVWDEPTIDYILGERDVWEGTEVEHLVLDKRGDFPDQGGQHTAVAVRDESSGDARHYLDVYDNNYWQMRSRPDYRGNVPDGASTSFEGEDGAVSKVRRYLVDTDARAYELVDEFDVPYSPLVSSAQRHDGNVVVASGMAKVVGEYTEEGTLLAEYSVETEDRVYRALKYTFEDFWFPGAEG